MNLALNFVKSALQEIKKVQWPTRKEAFRLTLYVIGISLIASLIVVLLDFVFTELLAKIISIG